jgi:hypothetical protein
VPLNLLALQINERALHGFLIKSNGFYKGRLPNKTGERRAPWLAPDDKAQTYRRCSKL